jgi:hypothetical protein
LHRHQRPSTVRTRRNPRRNPRSMVSSSPFFILPSDLDPMDRIDHLSEEVSDDPGRPILLRSDASRS